jgi:hypothetical protein
LDAITDIITAERQHRTHGTNIQQKVNDRCDTAGRFLAERRGSPSEDEEGALNEADTR